MPADLNANAFILISRCRGELYTESACPRRRRDVRDGTEIERARGAVSSFWDKLQPAARGEAGARASDVDYRLLVPLLFNVAIIQAVYAIVRVTTSYRAIELKLPVVWLGIISATFAILPIIFAVQVGRFLDRGKDAQAAGSARACSSSPAPVFVSPPARCSRSC